jgi:hypothetical protein
LPARRWPPGNGADVRDTGEILEQAARTLDFGQQRPPDHDEQVVIPLDAPAPPEDPQRRDQRVSPSRITSRRNPQVRSHNDIFEPLQQRRCIGQVVQKCARRPETGVQLVISKLARC